MPRVYLGVGSNIERERYIVAGLDALTGLFGELELSSVYDSAAIGFDGQPFLNLAVAVDTRLELAELARTLRHIEVEHGRPANAVRFSARQLDIGKELAVDGARRRKEAIIGQVHLHRRRTRTGRHSTGWG